MYLKLSIISLILLHPVFLVAQSITGNFNQQAGKEIRLEGFNGLKTYPISSSIIDEKGNFSLTYSDADYGVGYLMSSDEKALFVILSGEVIEIAGEALSYSETIKITKGQENIWFEQYAQEQQRREQVLSAWVYLQKIYTFDSLFSVQKLPSDAILKEKRRIQDEDEAFLNALPQDSYVRWFFPVRKLISTVSVVAQYRTEDISATISAFREMDYTDPKLYKSGLLKDAIDSHFWLLENSGLSLDGVFEEMKISIDALIEKLVTDEIILNEVTGYLFNLLEQKSLFQASAYMALKVLNDVTCTIDSNLARKLETYRVMKIGNTAPDIKFGDKVLHLPDPSISKLSDIQSEYTLVVFAASWCQKCVEEIPELGYLYSKWKAQGLEVVTVSLDTDPAIFESFFSPFAFVSICDLKSWEGLAVNDYLVFSTPTMFLLDKNRKIILRPKSVKQIDAWLDWVLIGKN